MMRDKSKLIRRLAGIIFMLHMTMLLLGALHSQLSIRNKALVNDYVFPLFPQPWEAFGSDADANDIQLELRSFSDTLWSDWTDAGVYFGYNSNSASEAIEQGINDELRWQILNNLYSEGGIRKMDRILESASYGKALYFVLRYQRYNSGSMPDSVQLRLSIRFTPPPHQAYTFQRTYLDFPVYDVP